MKDLTRDACLVVGDIWSAGVRVVVATIVFIGVGHVEYSVAVSTACLLGATDFFAKTRNLRTPKKVKQKMLRTRISTVSLSHTTSTGTHHATVTRIIRELR